VLRDNRVKMRGMTLQKPDRRRTPRMPALFVGHGSPMNALQRNRYTEAWTALGASLQKPAAVLAISAHWYINGTAVTGMPMPRTIHDFGGFPAELFAVQYPAAGDPALAQRIVQLLGAERAQIDQRWGLDHGTWSVLTHIFPKADVPVLQLSIDARMTGSECLAMGAGLRALRDEGVLIFGSGNVVHNLARINWQDAAAAFAWAQEFEDTVRARLQSGDHAALADYQSLGAAAQLSIPTPEHYLPLLYVLGAAHGDDRYSIPVDGIELGSISMLSVLLS
jgi:4,5-DOPA dioxygenase extradiol